MLGPLHKRTGRSSTNLKYIQKEKNYLTAKDFKLFECKNLQMDLYFSDWKKSLFYSKIELSIEEKLWIKVWILTETNYKLSKGRKYLHNGVN